MTMENNNKIEILRNRINKQNNEARKIAVSSNK